MLGMKVLQLAQFRVASVALLAFSGSVETFIDETPNCQGLGSCGFSMTQSQ